MFLGLAALWLGLAVYAFAHVSTLDPGRSVEDPAMILGVLFGLISVQAFIAYLRQRPTENVGRAPAATPNPARTSTSKAAPPV